MRHDVILSHFRKCVPRYAKPSKITTWFPNGKNSIRVRFEDNADYVFTYNGDNDWCFETVDCFIRRLKGV